jgi:hypothetical protein
MFWDLYDQQTQTIEGDRCNPSEEKTGWAYSLNGEALSIKETTKYLYPSNHIVIKVVKQESIQIGNSIVTKMFWNDCAISFSSVSQGFEHAWITFRFPGGFCFSMTQLENDLEIGFSDSDNNHFRFCDNGTIVEEIFQSGDKTQIAAKEIRRVYTAAVTLR